MRGESSPPDAQELVELFSVRIGLFDDPTRIRVKSRDVVEEFGVELVGEAASGARSKSRRYCGISRCATCHASRVPSSAAIPSGSAAFGVFDVP